LGRTCPPPTADETAKASDTPDHMVPPSRMVCIATISNILTNTKVTTFEVPATTSAKGNDILGVRLCKKVKYSRYRPGVAQRVGRGIALLLHDGSTRRGRVVT